VKDELQPVKIGLHSPMLSQWNGLPMRKAMVAQVEDIFTNNTALVLNRYLLDDIYICIYRLHSFKGNAQSETTLCSKNIRFVEE
jgi:hypothetical protein